VLCEECNILRCPWCHEPDKTHNFDGVLPCEHICSDCGRRAEDLLPCQWCEYVTGDERCMCDDCVLMCELCRVRYCEKNFCVDTHMLTCGSCACSLCKDCASETAVKCGAADCETDCFCEQCEARHVMTPREWAAELQQRTGQHAVDARVIARLLAPASSGAGDDDGEEDGQRICEHCAMTLSI
jgi:hypothetical protein